MDIPPSWASLRYFSRHAGRRVVLIQWGGNIDRDLLDQDEPQ